MGKNKKRRNIYFTSDLHFSHTNVIDFCERPFKTIEEMDEHIIKKWNKRVKDCDIVYVLGDVQWFIKKTDILPRLKGTKILIRGNHDRKASFMVKRGFDFAVEEAVIMIAGQRVRLSHYPYRYTRFQEFLVFLKNPFSFFRRRKGRFLDRRPKNEGGWLLHGHTHSKEKIVNKMIHIGWDAWNDLVPIQKLEAIISKEK